MGQTTKPTVLDAIEDDVDEAIRICDGDARLAVRRLILGQRQIRSESETAVSAGYVRRRLQ